MATFSAHTASPPPRSRTPAGPRASSRHASIAPRTTSAHGPRAWAARRTRTHPSIPAPPAPAGASRLPRTVSLGRVTMKVFVRGHLAVITAPVQCDVDGVPKGSHCVLLERGSRPKRWASSGCAAYRLHHRPLAGRIRDLPIVLLGIGEIGMTALELLWSRGRLADPAACPLDLGNDLVHLLGGIDRDPQGGAAHPS